MPSRPRPLTGHDAQPLLRHNAMSASPSPTPDKVELRRDLRLARRALSPAARQGAAAAVIRLLQAAPWWHDAATVALYLATEEELDLGDLSAGSRDKRWVYPRVQPGSPLLTFHALDAASATVPGPGGIRQPDADSPPIDRQQIDVFIVPLVGCADDGTRLGYGGGFYDRVLADCRGLRVGVGFAVQRVAKLPREPHDQTLDGFVSERGIETFSNRL